MRLTCSECFTEGDCTGADGQWQDFDGSGWCVEGCSTTNLWNCYDEGTCTGAGGAFVDGYCGPPSVSSSASFTDSGTIDGVSICDHPLTGPDSSQPCA